MSDVIRGIGGLAILIALSGALIWGEARVGLWRIRRELAGQGRVLTWARWRPNVFSREATFLIEVQQGGKVASGTAVAGRYWVGPVFSGRVEFDFAAAPESA